MMHEKQQAVFMRPPDGAINTYYGTRAITANIAIQIDGCDVESLLAEGWQFAIREEKNEPETVEPQGEEK